ncbi:ribonucleoprotein [Marine Group I thaumarchaeote]|jgi:small nuclear ribonucleoprotein|uniref:Ribonucleoprotein n=2 Tax=Marine Group I thaumarchaeote TaxID=2511932 RepID=A0A7K4P3L1_9ARCH|nr:MAG: ribonucleoprotein [Nitrosopumilus sp. YT1]KPU81157.1 ribonucleoprotein [Nitrosopumilus sp. PRT-SC01]MCH2405005.1 ribonucleoprotein [Nitrosopumilus sp.]NMI81764.1 ribonucleoprotein [Candidatus Nitrosopumilus sp. MTA1]NWJ19702.1 ribonucleoprotein [Marine Group I thaumarchaeote]
MSYEISTLMNNTKDKLVTLKLRNTKTIQGILKEFDIHMNMTLEDAEDVSAEKPEKLGKILIRGDNILTISMDKD